MTKYLNISTDNALGGNSPSDSIVSSQKAIKEYVDSQSGTAPQFANIQGSPEDNAALQNALNAKANTDLSNLTNTGKNIGLWCNNAFNITTEISQDIKLELNNGTLTLKAGSKLYKPNGDGVFGTITTDSDKTITGTTNATFMVVYTSGNNLALRDISRCVSGATRPLTNTYMLWYDTTNNVIYNYGSDSTTPMSTTTFPLAIVTVSGGAISSIDQVFNGLTYIGTAWAMLPEIKGIVSNGLNDDGTCKNITFTNPSVYVYTPAASATRSIGLMLNQNGTIYNVLNTQVTNKQYGTFKDIPTTLPNTGGYWYYATDANQWYYSVGSTTANWGKGYPFFVGQRTDDGTTTTSFIINRVFQAVDYNDTEYIAHQAMPSDRYIAMTLGASGATYTAPADGYVCLAKSVSAADQYVDIFYSVSTCHSKGYGNNNGDWATAILPVFKGQAYQIQYDAGGITRYFKFIYAIGAQ